MRCALLLPATALLVGGCAPGLAPSSDGFAVVALVPSWESYGLELNAQLTTSPDCSGDVNGDGYGDLLTLAIAGDLLTTDDGVARLYLGGPDGLSTTPVWAASSGQAGALLSEARVVGDLNGDGMDEIAVGAARWDSPSDGDVGRVEVYLGAVGGPSTVPWWDHEGAAAEAFYGSSIAPVGDFNGDGLGDLAIGCAQCDLGGPDEGTATVFFGDPAGLAATPDWGPVGCSGQAAAECATVVHVGDVDGDGASDLLVVAPAYDAVASDEGAAFLHLGSTTGTPDTAADWTAVGGSADAILSFAAGGGDLNGDGYPEIALGVPGAGNGQLRVHSGGPSGPSALPVWTFDAPQAGALQSAAISGDVDGDGRADLLIGLGAYDGPGGADAGRAILYRGAGTPNWVSAQVFQKDGGDTGWALGSSVGFAHDVDGDGRSEPVLAGQSWDEGWDSEGAVFLHSPSAAPSSAVAAELFGVQTDSWTGGSWMPGADFDADGFDDLMVGARLFDGSFADEGRAQGFAGGVGGPDTSPFWEAFAGQAGAQLGTGGAAGDFNGDGYLDFATGAQYFDEGQPDEGTARAYFGSATGLSPTHDWFATSDNGDARMGLYLDAGDFDGDGYDDLAASALTYSDVEVGEGAAGVWYGSPTGPEAAWNTWEFQTDQNGAQVRTVAVGDFDGDGYDDLAVGSDVWSNGQGGEGRVWTFAGSPSGLPLTPSFGYEPNQSGAAFGTTLATADFDGDGDDELAVGSSQFGGDAGRVWVLQGTPGGLSLSGLVTLDGADRFGWGLGAGDFDGDGFPDLAVTSYDGDDVQIFFGGPPGLAGDPETFAVSVPAPGVASVTVGDFDGDGIDDLAVGNELTNGSSGAWSVHLGGAGAGNGSHVAPPAVRLVQTGTTTPLAPGGVSDSGGFDLLWHAWAPGGFARAKLQIEAKPHGTPFDGTPDAESPDWLDVPPGGADLTATVSGLAASTPHHWRARVIWDRSLRPLVPATRWIGGDPRHPRGTHLRTGPDGDGDGFIGVDDCDDSDPLINPAATEVCNGVDDDCDGASDADDPATDVDLDGSSICDDPADCDDADPTVHPTATQACDGIDNDCDGLTDATDPDTDADADGFSLCDDPADCDDADAGSWPGGPETCADGLDTDCDGSVVDEFTDTDADGQPDCVDIDADGDGQASTDEGGSDCNDLDATVFDNATELCDGLDNDCNDTVPGAELDLDEDGWVACPEWLGDGSIDGGGDCAPEDSTVHPGAPEVCDDIDQDCDGGVDEGLPVVAWYRDGDSDGFGNPEVPHEDNLQCDPGDGWVQDDTDCDDFDAEVHPGATEVEGNLIDEDCDGTAQGAPVGDDDDASLPEAPAAPGCTCSSASSGPPTPVAALLLVALATRRRRRW